MIRTRSRERLPGIVAPVLTAPILSGIHRLNRDYVELLIAGRECETADALPSSVISGLRALSPQARAALTACPFALYALGIEHQDFWRNQSGDSADPDAYVTRESLPRESAFAINALFFAWHIASSQRVAAKVLYALADNVIDRLIPLPLVELQSIACRDSALLAPRWPGNAAFWPDLVRFAALGDAQRLTTTQLLGSQLIAADLRTNAATRGLLRPLSRVTASVTHEASGLRR